MYLWNIPHFLQRKNFPEYTDIVIPLTVTIVFVGIGLILL